MSKIQKIFIIGGLGAVCVLAFVMKDFLNPSNSQIQFSTGKQSQSSKSRLHKCKKGIQEVVNNKRAEYRCRISTKKTQDEASYTVQSLIVISRKSNGEIAIEISGKMRNSTRHATEATFLCEGGCSRKISLNDNTTDAMKLSGRAVEMISDLETEADNAVREAKASYDQKQTGMEKADRCLGKWHNQNGGHFEDFNIDKQLNCKFNKLYSIKDPIERELFLKTLKQDLWGLAISDTEDNRGALQAKLLDVITDSYYSPSTQSSASLLAMYLNWRKNYDLMTDIEQKTLFLNRINIEASNFSSQLDPRYAQDDLTLLNEGIEQNFQEALARIRSVPLPSASSGTSNTSLPAVDHNLKQRVIEIR